MRNSQKIEQYIIGQFLKHNRTDRNSQGELYPRVVQDTIRFSIPKPGTYRLDYRVDNGRNAEGRWRLYGDKDLPDWLIE